MRVTHVKGLLLYELPRTSGIVYEWETPETAQLLYFVIKGMSNLDKTVPAKAVGYSKQIGAFKEVIWLHSKTTVERSCAIRSEFYDLIIRKDPNAVFRLHRKLKFVCAFSNNMGGMREGLLAVIKPYDYLTI